MTAATVVVLKFGHAIAIDVAYESVGYIFEVFETWLGTFSHREGIMLALARVDVFLQQSYIVSVMTVSISSVVCARSSTPTLFILPTRCFQPAEYDSCTARASIMSR